MTEREYFPVVANQIEFCELDIGYLSIQSVIITISLILSTHMIPWIDEFIQQSSISLLYDYELMELTDDYYFYEFAILHGSQYSKDETGIYVFHDDDSDIVVMNGDANLDDFE